MVWEGSDITEEVISQVEFAGFSSHIYCFPLLPSGLQSASPRVLEEGDKCLETGLAVILSSHTRLGLVTLGIF